MFLKASLACDDVRIEADGAVTLVGVRGAELRGSPLPDGGIEFPRLIFVTIVGGLRGAESIEVRHAIRPGLVHALRPEVHDPTADDHVFLLGDVPMVFPREGTYDVETEVVRGDERVLAHSSIVISARP